MGICPALLAAMAITLIAYRFSFNYLLGGNMKPINRVLGFWTLMALSLGMTYTGEPTAAVIALVGGMIFDTLHTLKS